MVFQRNVPLSRHKTALPFVVVLFLIGAVLSGTALSVFGQDPFQQISQTDKLIFQYQKVYALTGVRVVVGNGQTLNNITIVLKNGLIDALGANVPVPNEAEVINGTGLTVYSGFVDAHTSLGLGRRTTPVAAPTAAPAQPSQRPTTAQTQQQATTPEPNTYKADPNLRPNQVAFDEIDFNDTNFQSAREAGIGVALSINQQGVFPGKSSVVSTYTSDPLFGVIKNSSFQFIQYSSSRGGYPSTLMAVVAFQRQALMDAQYYMNLEDWYIAGPRGMTRPTFDPAIHSLYPVIRGEETVVIPVSTELDIKRALDLAKQFKLKYILSGVVEGYRAIDQLKAVKVPLIVSVSYPQPRSTTGYAFYPQITPYEKTPPPGAPAQPQTQRATEELDKMIQDQLYANASVLYKAGLQFVISAGSDYRNFIKNFRSAVNAGLPADVALAKITTEPAQFLGIADVAGTVETGKIANIVVTDGDLFSDKTAIKYVFIDGKKVEFAPPSAPAAGQQQRIRGDN